MLKVFASASWAIVHAGIVSCNHMSPVRQTRSQRYRLRSSSSSRSTSLSDDWHCFTYSRTPNCRSFIFSHQPLRQTSTRIFLPQISIGNVVADRTNDSAAEVANTPSRPTPLIQLVNVIAMTVAKAFRTKQTATNASPMTYSN